MEEARECWVCLEAANPDGAATIPTGCACRGSAGHAHLSCLVAATRHGADEAARHLAGHRCPTCKQDYTGPMELGLARALAGPLAGRSPDSNEHGRLANALQNAGEYAEARPLLEEHLAALRRSCGDAAHVTLESMVNLAGCRDVMGEPAAALALLEEALPACRRVLGGCASLTIQCMDNLTTVHYKRPACGISVDG